MHSSAYFLFSLIAIGLYAQSKQDADQQSDATYYYDYASDNLTKHPKNFDYLYDDQFYYYDESSGSKAHTCPHGCSCQFDKLPNAKSSLHDYFEPKTKSVRAVYYNQIGEIYDIKVDCSNKSLENVQNLFSYTFPLDQITEFNLSFNNLSALDLPGAFEDMINLKVLDLSHNQHLRAPSPRQFLRKFYNLHEIHLNGLIQCPLLDCEWYRSLLFLHKRNVSIHVDMCSVKEAVIENVRLLVDCSEALNVSTVATPEDERLLPYENQILIEGDQLELVCITKGAQVEWRKDGEPVGAWANINEHVNRQKEVGTKLQLSNLTVFDSGQYECVANESVPIRTFQIQVLSLDELTSIPNSTQAPKCPSILANTYRGLFEWKQILAGQSAFLNCTVNPDYQAVLECLPDGEWSPLIDLKSCEFKSNLSRYISHLMDTNESIDLERLFRLISVRQNENGIDERDLTLLQRLIIEKQNEYALRWLNDIVSNLNSVTMERAQQLEPAIFSLYFFDYIIRSGISINSSVFHAHLDTSLGRAECRLDSRLACEPAASHHAFPTTKLVLDTEIDSDWQVTVLANHAEKLVPVVDCQQSSFKTNYNRHFASINKTAWSEVIVLSNSKASRARLNMTLKLNLPDEYFELMREMSQTANGSWTEIESKQVNLFEVVFGDQPNLFLRDAQLLKRFFDKLKRKWLNLNAYEMVCGHKSLLSDCGENRTEYSIVNWQRQPQCPCSLVDFVRNESDWNVFARAECSFDSIEQLVAITVSLKQNQSAVAVQSNSVLTRLESTVNAYLTNMSQGVQFEKVRRNYRPFDHLVVYGAATIAAVLLLSCFLVYVLKSASIQMPRQVRHSLANIWLSVLLLLLTFTLGINQINLPDMCLSSGFFMHSLILSVLVWSLLYFHCLLGKLKRVRSQNRRLITATSQKSLEQHHGLNRPGRKHALHLYLIGYGVPLVLCSGIFALTRQNYIRTPYSFCFSNHPLIVYGSLLAPFLVCFLIGIGQIVAISLTLRRILSEYESDPEKDCDDKLAALGVQRNFALARMMQPGVDEPIDTRSELTRAADTAANTFKPQSMPDSYSLSEHGSSDRTSIMDQQYRPRVQVGFFTISFMILCLAFTFAALLALPAESTLFHVWFAWSPKLVRLVTSYLFSFSLISYGIMQLCFYVLGRSDLTNATAVVDYYESSQIDVNSEECEPLEGHYEAEENLQTETSDPPYEKAHKESICDLFFADQQDFSPGLNQQFTAEVSSPLAKLAIQEEFNETPPQSKPAVGPRLSRSQFKEESGQVYESLHRPSPNKPTFDDLVDGSCSANTGTAISSIAGLIPDVIKSSLPSEERRFPIVSPRKPKNSAASSSHSMSNGSSSSSSSQEVSSHLEHVIIDDTPYISFRRETSFQNTQLEQSIMSQQRVQLISESVETKSVYARVNINRLNPGSSPKTETSV
nr:G protein-coupled receptor [Proales similis]